MVREYQIIVNKQFSSIRNLADNNNSKDNPLTSPGRRKSCRNCGHPATKEVLFAVGNDLAVIERYCEPCAQRVLQENGAAAKGSTA